MEYDEFCIICLEDILKDDAIWSCSMCYCEYHLVCISNWIFQYQNSKKKTLIEEQESLDLSEGYNIALNRLNKLINDADQWSCPKCRNMFSHEDSPNKYFCYCGKVSNPKNNHWLKPHTCGEICGKFLKPYCGDTCLELCHRGPCPPCPKILKNSTCFCGKRSESVIRCCQRFWSCGKVCDKALSCGIHFCDKICHVNCGQCDMLVTKACLCNENSKTVKCSEDWQCSKNCKTVDESLLNKCPCGKTNLEDLSSGDGYKPMTCKDTCDKILDCGIHRCTEKCHLGGCSDCKQVVSKTCRCGATVNMALCHKKLTCNNKCARWKNCNKHQCKRRCCDPNLDCATCELTCGNLLGCRKHRCQMRCHSGPCFPCRATIDVSCSCGSMMKRVTCGANINKICENLTKICVNPCKAVSKCHHENRHKCHSKIEDCPPCKEICTNALSCGHKCQKVCHDSIKTVIRLDKSKLAGPWEAADDGKIIYVSQSCPPCDVELSLICFGAHELIKYECSRPIMYGSCGKQCDRLLSCGNHTCSLECHPVSNNKCPDKLLGEAVKLINASPFCEDVCNKICQKPLQQNKCQHPCSKILCHKGPCDPCTRYIPYKCFCGSLTVHIECSFGPNPPVEKLSCPSRCPRILTKLCGHQCPRNCHPGNCEDVELKCKVKVSKSCPCGQKKASIPCWKLKNTDLKCDPNKCHLIETNDIEEVTELSSGVDGENPILSKYFRRNISIMIFLSILIAISACFVNKFL